MSMSLFPRVQETLAATLRVRPESIAPDTEAESLPAWDSLGHVNLMMALEQTFDVYIEVEDFDRLRSVPAILAYLSGRGVA
jgi:acyl carrier protein